MIALDPSSRGLTGRDHPLFSHDRLGGRRMIPPEMPLSGEAEKDQRAIFGPQQ